MCYFGMFQNVTKYTMVPQLKTPQGIAVDSSGFKVDLLKIDQLTNDVEACLRDLPDRNLYHLPPATHCLRGDPDSMKRGCLKIKMAPDTHVGCMGDEVFPCNVDPAICVAKGQVITPTCPCECRTAIQDNNVIIATPSLKMYRAELVRLLTTCNNIWAAPTLVACAGF